MDANHGYRDFGSANNPYLDLVSWLTTRTEQKRLQWNITLSLITTTLSDSTAIQFICGLRGDHWHLFTVHDKHGNEIIRATPPATYADENPILAAVDNLFHVITNSANRAAALH